MNKNLLQQVVAIAIEAGREIMAIYENVDATAVLTERTTSPQIHADMVAHQFISDALKNLSPRYPILSEESTDICTAERRAWQTYWLIDPLDGTRDFIAKTGQFSINIALIDNHIPVLGAVYLPATGVCYFADGMEAFKLMADGNVIPLHANYSHSDLWNVAVSQNEDSSSLEQLLQVMKRYSLIYLGSSLKICLLAEGVVDLYPRFFLTSEWDTAAAHCILLALRGDIYINSQQVLRYNLKDSLLNPPFIAARAHEDNLALTEVVEYARQLLE